MIKQRRSLRAVLKEGFSATVSALALKGRASSRLIENDRRQLERLLYTSPFAICKYSRFCFSSAWFKVVSAALAIRLRYIRIWDSANNGIE